MATEPENEARAAIRPVKERVEDALIAQPGVVAVDIGHKVSKGVSTGELSIVVYVDKKKSKSALPKDQVIPAEIDGIKTDVKELTIELQPARELADGSAFVDATVYPTLTGGISMGPVRSIHLDPPDVATSGQYVFSGTLGALVRDRASGATMALTNFHVACLNNSWTAGDRMVQPSIPDGGGSAVQFGSLARGSLTDQVDAAVITLDAGRTWEPTIRDIGNVAGPATAIVGEPVRKRGRTTELTFGGIASTDFTANVNYGGTIGMRTLKHQLRINTDVTKSPRFSDHGDSGSMVVNASRHVVGLLFAGSNDGSMTFANPIATALDTMGVDLMVRIISVPLTRIPVLCPTRVITTCITRSPVLCRVTRSVICLPTRPITCRITRTPICEMVYSRPACPPGPIFSRACNDPSDPFNPRGPIEIPGGRIPGFQADYSDPYGGQYSTGEFEDDATYWAGYLAALEDLSDEGTE